MKIKNIFSYKRLHENVFMKTLSLNVNVFIYWQSRQNVV